MGKNARFSFYSVFALVACSADHRGEEAVALWGTHQHRCLVLMHYFNLVWTESEGNRIELHGDMILGESFHNMEHMDPLNIPVDCTARKVMACVIM
jgi:hypothetical protein